MTKADDGKYCSKCAKNVVDFTGLSDAEIIRLIERTAGPLCGNLKEQQLNRTYSSYCVESASQSPLYRILAGLILFSAAENTLARENNLRIEMETSADSPGAERKQSETATQSKDSLTNVVQGILVDSTTKEPLVYAAITVKSTKTLTMSELDGKFSLIIPDSIQSDNMTLVITDIGYTTTEIDIRREELINGINLSTIPIAKATQMFVERELRGAIAICRVGKFEKGKKWWQFWK